ncbi:MAG: hypothetical protein OEZ06_11960 [Myxococcales bacterium]|nr:hypothetical protein [Myxococcales bacterium]
MDSRPQRDEYDGQRDLARFWALAKPQSEPVASRLFLPGALLLLIASVPFYPLPLPDIAFGMPSWVWVTLLCSALLSALTGWAALARWHDDRDTEL